MDRQAEDRASVLMSLLNFLQRKLNLVGIVNNMKSRNLGQSFLDAAERVLKIAEQKTRSDGVSALLDYLQTVPGASSTPFSTPFARTQARNMFSEGLRRPLSSQSQTSMAEARILTLEEQLQATLARMDQAGKMTPTLGQGPSATSTGIPVAELEALVLQKADAMARVTALEKELAESRAQTNVCEDSRKLLKQELSQSRQQVAEAESRIGELEEELKSALVHGKTAKSDAAAAEARILDLERQLVLRDQFLLLNLLGKGMKNTIRVTELAK